MWCPGELQRHGLAAERETERGLIELAYRMELPLVATNPVAFADPSYQEAHDVMLCIADGAYVETKERRRQADLLPILER